MKSISKLRFLSSFSLHILAMVFMLSDHLWGTVMNGHNWMTNVGRLAFPIFSFLLVEGFFHTHSIKKYFLRLLVGALISELPFNLMMGGTLFYPFGQNVMWTFLIALSCMTATEYVKNKKPLLTIPAGILFFLIGAILGFTFLVDYYGYGVLMVGVFFAFRGNRHWNYILQIAGMYCINVLMFGGMQIDISILGHTFEVVQQGFAVLALIPIWLYNGKRGPGGWVFQLFCYLFYPLHILLLSLAALYLI